MTAHKRRRLRGSQNRADGLPHPLTVGASLAGAIGGRPPEALFHVCDVSLDVREPIQPVPAHVLYVSKRDIGGVDATRLSGEFGPGAARGAIGLQRLLE